MGCVMKIVLAIIVPIISMLFLLSGCAATIDLAKMRESKLDETSTKYELPSYIKEKTRPKVAVLPITDTTQYNNLKLAETAQDTLTQLLVASGGVEVIERSQLKQFMEEIKFKSSVGTEIDADQFAKIAKNVDTVFVGTISSAAVTASFTEASSYTDKKGKTHNSPPSCSEVGAATINFRALASPAGTIMNSFQVKSKSNRSREVRSSHECKVQSPGGLLSEAINKAIDDAKEDIANTFPSFGYIFKTMTDVNDPKKRIAYINLGRNDGIAPGNKVDIFEFIKEKDRVTGGARTVQRTICEAVVSETQFLVDSALVIIPEDALNSVLVGQAVKTKANVGVFRAINKALK